MFKIFQKLQSKIPKNEKGWVAIGTALLSAIASGVGIAVGTVATKALSYSILIIAIYGFATTLYWAFITIGLNMLAWGIKGPFGSMSMTNPAGNMVIQIGWTLLRDLTNMFFILGLAYIGLATALNFASFNTKKTFTTLILIALLINFTPVICGLVVDGTNIIMNFFLSEVDFSSIGDSWIKNIMPKGTITNEKQAVDEMFILGPKHALIGIYSIMAGAVLTIFGALLIMRHFIVWLLVILSPLAFFCKIFSFSEQWYKKWWSTFISWSFIGIPAAFFLYLANHLMILAKSKQLVPAGDNNSLGTELTPYFVTIVFMVIGLILTLKIRAAGSGLIMNTANKLATKAKSVPGLIKTKIAQPMGKNIGAKAGAFTAGALSSQGRAAYTAAGGGKAGRQAMAQAGVVKQREGQQARAALQERLGIKPRELEDISEEDLKKVASTPATTPDGMLRRAKAIKKLVDDDNFDFSGTQAEEMLAVMARYPGMNIDKLKKARPELAHLIDTKGYEAELAKLPGGAGVPGNESKARFNLTLKTAKRMSAEQLAQVPFKDFSDPATSPEKKLLLAAVFAGITPAKVAKIAEYSGSAENLTALYKFSDPAYPEYAEVDANITPANPEYQSVVAVRKNITTPPLNINFPPP